MFTGLVLGMGEITRITPGSNEARFTIRTLFPAPEWVKGESIAVNGVCLSVETFDAASFTAFASAETLAVTNLKEVKTGHKVNLERAMAMGDRIGGHLVSGHVDGLAQVEGVTRAGSSLRVRMRFPQEFSPQVIPKGSVALDGISLTVNNCGPGFLEVNIIPETQSVTTIAFWKPGYVVNFETDLIGKYVQQMLGAWQGKAPESRLTMDFLRENGF